MGRDFLQVTQFCLSGTDYESSTFFISLNRGLYASDFSVNLSVHFHGGPHLCCYELYLKAVLTILLTCDVF